MLGFFLIWAIAEYFLRARPLASRMKAAAMWAITLNVVIEVNNLSMANPSSTVGQMWGAVGLALILFLGTAAVFYWFRIGLAKIMNEAKP